MPNDIESKADQLSELLAIPVKELARKDPAVVALIVAVLKAKDEIVAAIRELKKHVG